MTKALTPKIDAIKIVKTLEEKAPKIMKEVKSIQKEQAKYQEFLKRQSKGQYGYIETQSFSTTQE